jgi:three-Cys-motif partner protein
MKHLVFADYFDKWVKILGRYHKLNYFDCFGGCGAYEDDNGKIWYGSPIRGAQVIQENRSNLNRKVNIVIIDENKENLENIKKILEYLKIDIKPFFINEDFDKSVNGILDSVGKLAPTFFFIDPFGFKIKMKTLKRIMEIPKTEILLNFMFDPIRRFIEVERIENTLNDLFGDESWKGICKFRGNEREVKLIDLYKEKLKQFSKFVCYYRLSFPDKDRTYYYLFHLTNNIKGCSIMRSCFAKYNFGRLEYRGKLNNQMTFLDFKDIKISKIRDEILKSLNTPKSYLCILENFIEIYLESNIYKAIKSLEDEGKINIVRDPELTKTGRKRESIEPQDLIIKKEA